MSSSKPSVPPGAVLSQTLHDPWHYKCPYCGAPNGQSCRIVKEPFISGRPRPSHKARVALAWPPDSAGSPTTGQEADRG